MIRECGPEQEQLGSLVLTQVHEALDHVLTPQSRNC